MGVPPDGVRGACDAGVRALGDRRRTTGSAVRRPPGQDLRYGTRCHPTRHCVPTFSLRCHPGDTYEQHDAPPCPAVRGRGRAPCPSRPRAGGARARRGPGPAGAPGVPGPPGRRGRPGGSVAVLGGSGGCAGRRRARAPVPDGLAAMRPGGLAATCPCGVARWLCVRTDGLGYVSGVAWRCTPATDSGGRLRVRAGLPGGHAPAPDARRPSVPDNPAATRPCRRPAPSRSSASLPPATRPSARRPPRPRRSSKRRPGPGPGQAPGPGGGPPRCRCRTSP